MEKAKKYILYAVFALINGYILGAGIALSLIPDKIFGKNAFSEVNISVLLLFAGIFFVLFMLIFISGKKVYRWTTPLCLASFAWCVSINSSAHPNMAIVMAITAAVMVFCFKKDLTDSVWKFLKGKNLYIAVAALTAIVAFFTAWATICRYRSFIASAFDFGVFAQMFESMATDFTQTTTIERGYAMSHFAVHFSPIYYLLLPFYMIFRTPEFLLAAQAAIVFSGIIPLLLLCKKYKYDEKTIFLISVVFVFYPAFSAPCFYDFHENAFLTPLILWLLYFVEKDGLIGTIISALLLMCVKEDAAIYVACIGLYALLRHGKDAGKRASGVILIGLSAAGFVIITSLMKTYGEGIFTSRFAVFLGSGESSVFDIVKNVIKDPALFFDVLFNDEDKLLLVLELMLPLMFIPFASKRLSDWTLFIPLIIMNFATDYQYMSNINFQYVFGTGALMLFLFVKNMKYLKIKPKITPALASALAAVIIFAGVSLPKYDRINSYLENSEYYEQAKQVLSEIPRDATVFAEHTLVAHVADIKELYLYPEVYPNDENASADYFLLDTRINSTDKQETIAQLTAQGYEIISDTKRSFVTVMKKQTASS